MRKWVWVDRRLVLAFHAEQLAEHGGGEGIRDEGLLESALARPLNLDAYGEPDAAGLAAAYAFGLAKNHPFIDGNKRTAAVAMGAFLGLNGYEMTAEPLDLAKTFLAVADGSLTEKALAGWIRANSKKLQR